MFTMILFGFMMLSAGFMLGFLTCAFFRVSEHEISKADLSDED